MVDRLEGVGLVERARAGAGTRGLSLAVTERGRDHGLWRALGMRPGTLRAVILGQLAAIGAIGALAGVYPAVRASRTPPTAALNAQ